MWRAFFAVSSLVALVAFAEPKSVPVPARDAGVAPVVRSSADAGVAATPTLAANPASSAELEKVKKELADVKSKLSELEPKAARVDSLAADLKSLQDRFDDLKAKVEASEERRESAEREVAAQKAQVAQANTTVNAVLQQLSSGNTSNTQEWLRGVEQQYSGQAAKLVGLARQALAQGDLSAARQYLNLALLEAAAR